MKPLHIPRIRRLDLTEGHWKRREEFRALLRSPVLMLNKLGRLYPVSAMPETVKFRRPAPFAYMDNPGL